MSDATRRTARPRGPLPVARHGRLKRTHPVATAVKVLVSVVAVVLASVLSIAGVSALQLKQDLGAPVRLANETAGPPPQIGDYDGSFNILIVGSDDGSGEVKYGQRGENLNDVTILLHVSADHSNAVAVSFPRDLMIPIPACPREDGKGNYSAMSSAQINVTLHYGGLACTVKTVESLTGLAIPYAGLIRFQGVVDMSNAIGGVPICADAPINDPFTAPFPLHLPAGTTYVKGDQALAFLRSRHGVGDGSDLGRINSQQVFLASLLRTVRTSDTLTNPIKLLGLAQAAAKNMQLSSYLSSPQTMIAMAQTLIKIAPKNIALIQYPSAVGLPGIDPNRVGPLVSQANALFDKLKTDQPFSLDPTVKKRGSVLDPNATPVTPTTGAPTPGSSGTPSSSASPPPPILAGIQGQTVDQQTCSVANR